jgi:hypothetical protein
MTLRQSGSGGLWMRSRIVLEPDFAAAKLPGVLGDETDICPFFAFAMTSTRSQPQARNAVIKTKRLSSGSPPTTAVTKQAETILH